MLEQLQEAYGDELRVVYRHFPLSSIHSNARIAAEAAEAAGAQDAFWEYHDLLFEKQTEWASLSEEAIQETLLAYATQLELDTEQFQADLEAGNYADFVVSEEDIAKGMDLTGTPTIFLNGYLFPSQQLPLSPEGIDFFMGIIRLLDMQYAGPEQVIDPSKTYQATISTEQGDIVIDLFADTAPVNVNSFAFLAQEGWYDNVTFHRVLDGFMAQGGDPSGTGVGWPGYRCEDEVNPTRSFDGAGVVAMANSGPNTNGAQFFITYGPTPHLNDGFTIIGNVASGQDVVDSLTRRNPENRPDFPGDTILSVVVEEK